MESFGKLIAKLAEVWPAAMVAKPGTFAFAGADDVRLSVTVDGAAADNVIVALAGAAPSMPCAGTANATAVPVGFAVSRTSSIAIPSVAMGNSSTWLKRILKVGLYA